MQQTRPLLIFFRIMSYLLSASIVGIIGYSLYQRSEPVSVIHGNYGHYPLLFTLEKTNDPISKMLIRTFENSCEVVEANGDTHFFAEPADMLLWLKEMPRGQHYWRWVYTIDTHRWINATLAWYGIRDKTVMGYGFGARERRCHSCIDFETLQQRMRDNQTLLNPKVRKALLEDNYHKNIGI